MTKPLWTPERIALVLLPAALLTLLAVTINDIATTQRWFVNSTYYFLMATVLCWAGTYLHAGRDMRRGAIVAWAKENWPGLVIAAAVTLIAWHAVEPALRVLSDEANLVGTSKNFFSGRTATLTVSGKNYYDTYWDIDVIIDRRPTLFPFLVSLVHSALGYSYKNVFLFNLMVLPAFVLVGYRLAKTLAGEVFAIVASLLLVSHPITLITVRSGSFDFFTVFFALLVLKSLLDYCREQSPSRLAILWMNLWMFSEIRYETVLFAGPVLLLLLLYKMVNWSALRPYAFVYALTPAFVLPRIWQAVLRGNVPEQDAGTITFSLENFANNAREYFKPVLSPFGNYSAHSALVIGLGVLGCVAWLRWVYIRAHENGFASAQVKFATFVAVWMALQVVIVFTYVWGRAQYPSAARLVIALDTFFSFAAAWLLTLALKRFRPFVPVMIAGAVLAIQVPVAAQHRLMNKLTQTRENATTWRFFEKLHEKRILIVTDRPNLFTIMDYGAMNFETARKDPYLFIAFDRHLFYDIYVVQQIRLSTKQPLPGYEIWPSRKLETLLEFQNDADVLIRISRVVHEGSLETPRVNTVN